MLNGQYVGCTTGFSQSDKTDIFIPNQKVDVSNTPYLQRLADIRLIVQQEDELNLIESMPTQHMPNPNNFLLIDMNVIERALQNDDIQYFGFVVPKYGFRAQTTLIYCNKRWSDGSILTASEVASFYMGWLSLEYFRYIQPSGISLGTDFSILPSEIGFETDLSIANMGVSSKQGDLRQLFLQTIGEDYIVLHKMEDINNLPSVTPVDVLIYLSNIKDAGLNYHNYDSFDTSRLKYQGLFGRDIGNNLLFDMWQAILPPNDARYATSYLGKLNWTPIGMDDNGNYTLTFK